MSSKWNVERIGNLSGKVAVVTGANSGIGYAAARDLAAHGARVILACRSPERGQDAVARVREEVPGADVRFEALDLADLDQVRVFAERVIATEERLDLLVNNAGVMVPPQSKTAQGFELQLGVNHFGHFALTGHLLPLITKTPQARIVTVSSLAHRQGKMRFDDLNFESGYSAWPAYGQSKLANLLFTFELARKLEAAGHDTKAVAAHPGWTATNLQQHSLAARVFNPIFAMTTDQGALPTLYAATAHDVDSGDYIGPDGFYEMRGHPKKVGSTPRAHNRDDAAQLWELSEELTGVSFGLEGAPAQRLAS
jgi:NAD(P)-dependent dehydrogenase (short-subunit alcohol dehydrogenase family)